LGIKRRGSAAIEIGSRHFIDSILRGDQGYRMGSMSDKRAVVVESCKECPRPCEPFYVGEKKTCPLPKWPSPSLDEVMNITLKMLAIFEDVKKGYLTAKESATDILSDWLKSIGVEIEDAD
jgi:hypothetical protein